MPNEQNEAEIEEAPKINSLRFKRYGERRKNRCSRRNTLG
jgi:hypothetical protein